MEHVFAVRKNPEAGTPFYSDLGDILEIATKYRLVCEPEQVKNAVGNMISMWPSATVSFIIAEVCKKCGKAPVEAREEPIDGNGLCGSCASELATVVEK